MTWAQEQFARIRKDLEESGTLKRSEEIAMEENCVVCGKELPEHLARYCSGYCMSKHEE